MEKNPFDFTDVSDLPKELAEKLKSRTSVQSSAAAFINLVKLAKEHSMNEVDINVITAAAIRTGMKPPSQATIRTYLNKAVDQGILHKPTRQTYSLVVGLKAA